MTDQEATVIDLREETDALASWPTHERLRALQRIIPRAQVEEVLAQTGQARSGCPRLPGWFMVWFIIALGLCRRDCYRQVFRWVQPFRPGATPGRSTLCVTDEMVSSLFLKRRLLRQDGGVQQPSNRKRGRP